MSLKSDIDAKRREISSDNLSMSIGEVLNLYKEEELDIHPEFQRVFRWTGQQKSRLIESLLLGIPLPSIYVATNDLGVWEVIDGVQRLSTIFEFMGELMGPGQGDSDQLIQKPALILEGTKHLPSLEGVAFSALEQTLRLEFKRTRLDMKILAREEGSATSGKFDLFERLNTYGTSLSPQELRNCILVSLNPTLFRWLRDLAEDDHFRSCTLLTETQLQERYDMDLALRFLTLRDVDAKTIGDVHDFLRERMERMAEEQSIDTTEQGSIFYEVFEFLDNEVNGNAFRPWSPKSATFRGAFSLAAYEGFGLALGKHWERIRPRKDSFQVQRVIQDLWQTPQYKASFSGLRARERMVRVMPAGEALVLRELERIETSETS